MSWINDMFHTEKPIIAMLHLEALPGDPNYIEGKGVEWIIEQALRDLNALQDGGVDAIMFSNEKSLPYLTKVEPITSITMARVIGELRGHITKPFGVNVLWDPDASINVAMATSASFVREIFTGVYGSDFGLWNTNCGATLRHRNAIGGRHIRLIFNILPEAAMYVSNRDLSDIARSTVFNAQPDALCVSGLTAGVETSQEALEIVKTAAQDVPVFANTGVRESNLSDKLSIADGAIVGTVFKQDGYIWNHVDAKRVKSFMDKVVDFRKSIA